MSVRETVRLDTNLAEVIQAAELLVMGTPGKALWDISIEHCVELTNIVFCLLPFLGYHAGVGVEEHARLINQMPWPPTANHRGRYVPENFEDIALLQGYNLIFYIFEQR